MEDGIEDNKSSLYEMADRIKENKKIKENKYVYICIPHKKDYKDYIITDDVNKISKILKQKDYTVEIFSKDANGLYKHIDNIET